MLKYIGEFERLKEFGFEYNGNTNTWEYDFYYDETSGCVGLVWIKYNKRIMIEEFYGEVDYLFELIEKLIKAGLVEKVVEE